jgi:hypothetical protein
LSAPLPSEASSFRYSVIPAQARIQTATLDLSKHLIVTSGEGPAVPPARAEAKRRPGTVHAIDHRGPTARPFVLSAIPIRPLHGFVHEWDSFHDRVRLNLSSNVWTFGPSSRI